MSTPHQLGSGRPEMPVVGDVPLGTAMSASAGAVLAATLEILCRGERLSTSEIGDHTDLVAELTDALASLTDRLAHDLRAGDPRPGCEGAARDLEVVRDGLARASITARRSADQLYRAHLGAGPSAVPPAG